MSNHPNQADFFARPVFETRQPVPAIDPDLFRLRLKTAMSDHLRAGEWDRREVAHEMARMINSPSFSKTSLDAYTSPSKTDHDISLLRFKAFTRVTDAPHLWDLVVSDEGLLVLEGDEARLAEIALLQQEKKALEAKLRALRSTPVHVKRMTASE